LIKEYQGKNVEFHEQFSVRFWKVSYYKYNEHFHKYEKYKEEKNKIWMFWW